MNWSASGASVAFIASPSHRIDRPVRRATTPDRAISVRWLPMSKLEYVAGPPRHAFTHSS